MPHEWWEYVEAARHEASHAVTSIVLGIGAFHRVVILREPDALGRFGYIEHTPGYAARRLHEPEPEPAPLPRELVAYASDPDYRPAVENLLRRYALYCYAGIAGQDRRSVGGWWSVCLLEASTQDRRTLSREFARWGRDLPERKMCEGYLRDARRLVDGHWSWSEAVADALLERLGESNSEGALSEAEVRGIIAATPRTRNPWRECQRWERHARAALAEQMRSEKSARERNAEGVVNLAERSTGRHSPAPLAALSADARERNGAGRPDTGRAAGRPSSPPALAGLSADRKPAQGRLAEFSIPGGFWLMWPDHA